MEYFSTIDTIGIRTIKDNNIIQIEFNKENNIIIFNINELYYTFLILLKVLK